MEITYIVTVAEMRELERRAESDYGLTSQILMENAGGTAAGIVSAFIHPVNDASRLALRTQTGWKEAENVVQPGPYHTLNDLEFLFLIGPGNNGGDGLVIARYLEEWGGNVSLYRWKDQQLVVHGQEVAAEDTSQRLEEAISEADYVLDSLLGTGRSRPLPDSMRELLGRVRQEREKREALRVIAIDLPTGLNADTGEVDPGTIRADITITFAYPKQGFFFFPGRAYIGELYIGDIGIPAELARKIGLKAEMLTNTLVESILPSRPLDSNKGTFGKVMLLCGSPPYPGSAYLAGKAAARAGGGLVTLAVTEQMLPIYASAFHEGTFVLLPEEQAGSIKLVDTLMNHLDGYRALLMGPGLGQSPYIREVILQVLERLRNMPEEKRPQLVVDADGLNNLSALEQWWTLLPPRTVITPHPGEMGRLLHGQKVSGGSIDRLELVRSKAKEWQVILLLKGACTILAEPDGDVRINWLANPALATAGTGDVLAGIIAGLLAQEVEPYDAASAGVFLHAAAGELVSANIGRAGLLASDLLPEIPRAMVKIKREEIASYDSRIS